MHFRDHLLSYILIPLFVIFSLFSYFRFIVGNDYIAAYEVPCNPETQSCFVGCEDDECLEKYYYAKAQKHAADLYARCGEDITDCEAASECLADDRDCFIIYNETADLSL